MEERQDLISRQAAIDALMEKDKKLRNINWYDNPYAEGECGGIDEALSIISNLPSAQPEPLVKESRTLVKDLVKEPCEDAVSRHAVIDIIRGYDEKQCELIGTPNDSEVYAYARGLLIGIKRNINALPSVTPKLAECDDAVSWEDALKIISTHSGGAENTNQAHMADMLFDEIANMPPTAQKPTECDDAIDRNKAYDEIMKAAAEIEAWDIIRGQAARTGAGIVLTLPSVNSKPTEGEWIYPSDVAGFGRCSKCRSLWEFSLINNMFFRYCPRCKSDNRATENREKVKQE